MDTYSCCADFAQLPRMKAMNLYTTHGSIENGGLRCKVCRLANRVRNSIVSSGKKAKAAHKRIGNVSTTYYTTHRVIIFRMFILLMGT